MRLKDRVEDDMNNLIFIKLIQSQLIWTPFFFFIIMFRGYDNNVNEFGVKIAHIMRTVWQYST